MANICSNHFTAFASEEDCDKIVAFLEEHFEADIDRNEDGLYAYFDSRWTRPESLDDFIDNLTTDKDFWAYCFSEEHGCQYVALREYWSKND